MQNVSIDLDVGIYIYIYVLHIDIYYVLTLYYSNTFTPLWQTVFFPRSHFIGCIKPCVFSILHLYKTKITDLYDVFDVKQKVSKPPLFTHVFGNWYLECFVKHTCTPAHVVKSVVFFHSISSSFHSWESKHIGVGRTAIFNFFRKTSCFERSFLFPADDHHQEK